MSAIAGILFFDGQPVEPSLVEVLTEAMSHCGPDARSHWQGGPVALGHCMLRTTPESLQERQPLSNEDNSVVLVWDGRLDNRPELQDQLRASGIEPRDESDAELVLQSYVTWGDQCPSRLLGDFSFAVWDSAQGRLFCARDHMGARPFFYTRTERFIAFASDEEALALLPGVSKAANEGRVAYHLVPTFLGFDYSRSWLHAALALGAAQSLAVSPDGVERIATYWQLQCGEEATYASDEECAQAFLRVFGEAVRCRMRVIGDVAAMVSGGLDSASIVAMIKRVLPETPGKRLHSYSAVSDVPESCVETRCILGLTEDLGANAHTVAVPSFTGMLSVKDLLDTAWPKAHPIDNSILLPAMMCLAAARAGHRVLLTGVCGDLTTHATFPYIVALLKTSQWRLAWRESRAAAVNHTYLQGRTAATIFLKGLYHAYAPPTLKRLTRSLTYSRVRAQLSGSLIAPALARKVGLDEWHKARDRQVGPFLTDHQLAHILSLQPPHGIASSLGGYNRVAGRAGVELRDPWADRRVVEFWLRLPLKYKFRCGWTKYLVRSSMTASLPPEVVWRVGKEHVGWHFFYRLMDESSGFVACTLEEELRNVYHFVSATAVGKRYVAYLAAKSHDDRESIFNLVTLVSWVKRNQ